MFYSLTIVVSLLSLTRINQINCIQCYKCNCTVIPDETTCTDYNELQCVIERVENNYCFISRSSNTLQLGHRPDSDLSFLESLHYIRAKEEIVYLETNSTWQEPTVLEFAYGCDWSLCNTPRILGLLPKGLTYAVDSDLLTATLIPGASESFDSCLTCTQCANSSSGLNCPTSPCNGTCFIDDHLDDSTLNTGSCSFAFESLCLPTKLNTSVQLTGTYYIDDNIFGITEIDIWCQRTDCNSPSSVETLQQNTTYSTQINDQLYFRPDLSNTTSPTPTDGLLGCYICRCVQDIGSDDCKLLTCTIEYKNASYCEIVRDLKDSFGREIITLGHVDRQYVPYKHYVLAEEELILYPDLTWSPPSISLITYVCDWELCNDGRLVEKLKTSFRFTAESSEIAGFLQGSEPLEYCRDCSLCTNSSLDFDDCTNVTCSNGTCFIDQYVDDAQFNGCEYAFRAECELYAINTSVIIIATYNIDDDILDIDEVDVYCTKDGCNTPSTVYSLLDLIDEDIQLDSLFFIRPVEDTTAPPTITEPTPSSTASIMTTLGTTTSFTTSTTIPLQTTTSSTTSTTTPLRTTTSSTTSTTTPLRTTTSSTTSTTSSTTTRFNIITTTSGLTTPGSTASPPIITTPSSPTTQPTTSSTAFNSITAIYLFFISCIFLVFYH